MMAHKPEGRTLMKPYATDKIRNICLMGHGGSGKTTFTEAALFLTKAIDRMGKAADGTTVSDFDPEEVKRKISVSTSLVPVEWKGNKINFIDIPGYFDFAGETVQGLRAADGCYIMVGGKDGVDVGTEKAWKACLKNKLPKAVIVTKVEEDDADFAGVLASINSTFNVTACPIFVPLKNDRKLEGFVNVIDKKAYKYDASGTPSEIPVPAYAVDMLEEMRNQLNEAIAETDEELMEKFFGGEEFTVDEINKALSSAIMDRSITPVLGCSSMMLKAIDKVLDFALLLPSPAAVDGVDATDANGEEIKVKYNSADPISLVVFKTVADPFVGKLSYFKVISGKLTSDTVLTNATTGQTEKFSHIYMVRGKKQVEVNEIFSGDLGAVTKLSNTNTGDSLYTAGRPVTFLPFDFPAPCLSLAVVPKAKGDEEKITSGLRKLMEEDPTLKLENNAETKQLVISGLGDMHLDVIMSKLKTKFGTSMELTDPKVPYRETIRKKVEVEGKHKKQSGGHGQYGHVKIEFEPGEKQELEFAERVFGGSVPKNFFPAVEKGLQDAVAHGVLAGYPVVNLKATLTDGSYHPVDSSEMAFKLAASLAYKAGLVQANPTLLEPIGMLTVTIPSASMGDIIGDINKRRGSVLGMDTDSDGNTVVSAYVPMAEMHKYSLDLRSMTKGRGSFSFVFDRYEDAPPPVAQKIIEEHKKDMQDSE